MPCALDQRQYEANSWDPGEAVDVIDFVEPPDWNLADAGRFATASGCWRQAVWRL